MHEPNGVEFATTHLATGLRVHYAERGDREGGAIIFLHAYVDSWFSYSRVLPLLSPSYHAFAPDQRGHGDSDKPRHPRLFAGAHVPVGRSEQRR